MVRSAELECFIILFIMNKRNRPI